MNKHGLSACCVPRLTDEEERVLAERIANGDADAEDRFVRANIALVYFFVRKMNVRPCDLDDIVGAGLLGLLVAVRKFDHTRGFRFSTYAARWIKDYMAREIQFMAEFIRTPYYLRSLTRNIATRKPPVRDGDKRRRARNVAACNHVRSMKRVGKRIDRIEGRELGQIERLIVAEQTQERGDT